MSSASSRVDEIPHYKKSLEELRVLYQPDPALHEALKRYPLTFLGRGAEHLVYGIAGQKPERVRTLVLKADLSLAKKFHALLAAAKVDDPSRLPEQEQRLIREKLQEDAEKQRALRRAFGSAHVVACRKSIERVPLPAALARELFKTEAIRSCWTVLTLQQRATELDDAEAEIYDLGADYLERNPEVDEASFAAQATSFLEERVIRLLEKAEQDQELAGVLQDFVLRAIKYTSQEGEILDLVGKRNAYFYRQSSREGRRWTYRLLDVLHTGGKTRDFFRARHVLDEFQAVGTIRHASDAALLMNTCAYVRTINGLATRVSRKERLRLLEEYPALDRVALFQEIRRHVGVRTL